MLENLSPKQISVYNEANAPINILEGSVRSGKSFICLLRQLIEWKDGPAGEYVVVGKNHDTIVRNVLDPLNKLCGGVIKYNIAQRFFMIFDKKVYCVGANDERAESKIRGSTFAGALVDEITVLPQSFFTMLTTRLSIPGAKLFGTTNPDSPYHWLKTEFIDRPIESKCKTFKFTLEDNPSLTTEFIDALKSRYRGLWYKRFILGEWVLAEGSVYDFFDRAIHCVNQPPSYAKYYVLGIDYGTTNPFAAVLVGYNDDVKPKLWVEKEYYWDSKATGMQMTDGDYAEAIKKQFSDYRIQMTYLDPSAASFEVELKRNKWPNKPAINDVVDGIRFVSTLLTNNNLVICNGCTNLIKEIESYVWDTKASERGEDKPIKTRDHALDAMRYALFSHFGQRHELKETSNDYSMQRSKEKQYARNPMGYAGFTSSDGWQRM